MAFKRNFAFRLAAEISAKILAMGVTIWLARSLGPEAWGGMQWALAAAGLFGVLADFGLGSIASREIALARAKEKAGWFLAARLLKGLLWILAILLFLAYRFASQSPNDSLLFPAALLTVAMSLGEFNSSLFSGIERLDIDFKVSTLSKAMQAAAAFGALALGASPNRILTSMAAAAWAGWALGFIALRQEIGGKADSKTWQRVQVLLKGLWPFGLVSVLTLVYVKADNLLLERLAGVASVGVYQSAYKWFEALGFVPAAFIAAAFPRLARSENEKDGLSVRMKAFKAMGGLGAGTAAFLFALAPILPWMLGERYAESPPLMRALAFSCLAWFPNYVLVNLLITGRKQQRVLYGAAVAVLFNLGGNLLLIPKYGALGSAWMTAATEGVIFTAAMASLGSSLPFEKAAPWLLKILISGLLGCALAWLLAGMLAPLALLLAPALALALAARMGLLPLDDLRNAISKVKER